MRPDHFDDYGLQKRGPIIQQTEAEKQAELQKAIDLLTSQTCPCCNGKGRIRIVQGTKDDQ